MPRKRPRDDDDDFSDVEEYDEDGRPLHPHRRREVEGSGMPLWVFGGLGVGGLLVIVVIVFLIRSGRVERERALVAEEAARAEQERIAALLAREPEIRNIEPGDARPRPPHPLRKDVVGQNWPKAIGKWQRTPAGKDDTDYPYYSEFRQDRGVTMTRINYDGKPKTQEAIAETQIDLGETLSLSLHVQMGTYGYAFTLKPDGTLVLEGVKGGLVFTRVK